MFRKTKLWWRCWPFVKNHKMAFTPTGEERDIWDINAEIRAMYQIIVHEHHGPSSLYPLLQAALNPFRFAEVEFNFTSYGSSFLEVIQAAMMSPDDLRSPIAPDPDAYRVFRTFFDSVFYHLHGFRRKSRHMPTFYGNFAQINHLDPTHANIKSLRIECSRNLKGFPFLPRMTPDDLLQVETLIRAALEQLGDKQKGIYEAQTEPPLDENLPPELAAWSYYPSMYEFDAAANFLRNWPIGRGVAYNKNKKFVTWINQEDHLKVIVRQPNGNLHQAYVQLYEGMTQLDSLLECAKDRRIGFYTVDPQRVGNGLRIIAHIVLPHLSRHRQARRKIVAEFGLMESRPPSEHGDEFVYTCLTSLGCSEYESFIFFQAAIESILEAEKKLIEVKVQHDALVDVAIKTLENYVAGVGDMKALEEQQILDLADRHEEDEVHNLWEVTLRASRRKKMLKKMMH